MKTIHALVCTLALSGCSDTADKKPAPVAKSLIGKWEVVSEKSNNASSPSVGSKFTFAHPKLSVRRKTGEVIEGVYEVDETTTPWKIDITTEDTKGKESFLGIGRIDDDTLTVCSAIPGEPRPKDFKIVDRNTQVLSVLKRVRENNCSSIE